MWVFFIKGLKFCNAAWAHGVRNIRKYASFVANICPYGMLVTLIYLLFRAGRVEGDEGKNEGAERIP